MAQPRKYDHQRAYNLHKQGLSNHEIARIMGVSEPAIFKAIKKFQKNQEKGGEKT